MAFVKNNGQGTTPLTFSASGSYSGGWAVYGGSTNGFGSGSIGGNMTLSLPNYTTLNIESRENVNISLINEVLTISWSVGGSGSGKQDQSGSFSGNWSYNFTVS